MWVSELPSQDLSRQATPGTLAHSLQQQGRQPLLMPPQSTSVSSASLMPFSHVGPKVHVPPKHWLLWQSLAVLQPCSRQAGTQGRAALRRNERMWGWTKIAQQSAGVYQ